VKKHNLGCVKGAVKRTETKALKPLKKDGGKFTALQQRYPQTTVRQGHTKKKQGTDLRLNQLSRGGDQAGGHA